MTERVDSLDTALAARDRQDWGTAYAALSDLRRSGRLDSEGLYALGDAAWWLGLIRETLEICEECHERFVADGRLDRAAMVALETGFHWMMRGEPEIGSGWLGRARRLLDGQPPSIGHGYLLWMESQGRFEEGDVEGALAGAAQMRQMAVDLAEPVLGCFGLALEGVAAVRGGDVARGFELLGEAMLPVLAGRIGPAEAGNLYCQMISICTDLADVARARRWTEATERWCDTSSSAVMFAGICRVHRAQLLRVQGDLDAAELAATTACVELAELNVEAVAEAHYEIGEARRLRGDGPGAHASYAMAESLGRVPEPGRSLLLLGQGQVEAAASAIARALAEEGDPFRRARLLAAQVEIACMHRDHAVAETAARELEEIAQTYRSPGFRAWAETARGAVQLGCGQPDQAVAPLRHALSMHREVGAGYDEATCRALLGEALHAAGDRVAAEQQWSAAHEALVAMGAASRAEWVAARAIEETTPPGGLTAREWEVLTAVGEGLSNRQVAARLVISEKTVARHLANVFAKLEVSSRTAAVAWARDSQGDGRA